jgi:hypothetical protein
MVSLSNVQSGSQEQLLEEGLPVSTKSQNDNICDWEYVRDEIV